MPPRKKAIAKTDERMTRPKWAPVQQTGPLPAGIIGSKPRRIDPVTSRMYSESDRFAPSQGCFVPLDWPPRYGLDEPSMSPAVRMAVESAEESEAKWLEDSRKVQR